MNNLFRRNPTSFQHLCSFQKNKLVKKQLFLIHKLWSYFAKNQFQNT